MFLSSVARRSRKLLRAATAFGILSLAALAAASTHRPKAEPAITIDSSVTIVENPQESGPVRRATDYLFTDFTKVFGHAPHLAASLD